MTRKLSTQKNTKISVSDKDRLYLQFLTRKLLRSIEQNIERLENADNEKILAMKNCHELLFGQKSSLTSTLITLSDLMLKLSEKDNSVCGIIPEMDLLNTLSSTDIVLVKTFVSKMKSIETVITHDKGGV